MIRVAAVALRATLLIAAPAAPRRSATRRAATPPRCRRSSAAPASSAGAVFRDGAGESLDSLLAGDPVVAAIADAVNP